MRRVGALLLIAMALMGCGVGVDQKSPTPDDITRQRAMHFINDPYGPPPWATP